MTLTDDPITCPLCGGDYLHHERIDVFNRNQEDSAEGLSLLIRGGEFLTTTNANDHNPSRRRNGIRIILWCEGCDTRSNMTVVQHKGQTFIEWERP